MKSYWMAVGIGAAVAIVGIILYTLGTYQTIGLWMVLGGMIVAVMGLVMRMVSVYMGDKAK